jgi:diguanylate cyclase (GGDEF)-like protein
MPLKPISPRLLTATYIVALLLIAGLSIASHIVLDYGLKSDEGSAAIINQTGRQRMLSQRIASLAAQYRLGDASVLDDLRSTIAAFQNSHDSLALAVRASTFGENTSSRLKALYFEGPNPLDGQIETFVSEARAVADLPPDDPAMPDLLAHLFAQARSPLLNTLNDVVTVHQRESERRVDRLESLQWAILGTILAALALEAIMIFRPMIHRVVTYTSELFRLANIDSLTGAANRRSFMERCEREAVRARRYDRPVSILMLDVDKFKLINDGYGHAAGDEVLKAVGKILRETVRDSDIWGRLGGEEFAVLLVETPLSAAGNLAERMRERFGREVVRFQDETIQFTVSIGVASVPPKEGAVEAALRVADHLMYQAKAAGRNRVVVDAPQPA